MQHKIIPYLLLTAIATTSFLVGCGEEDPVTPNGTDTTTVNPSNPDTAKTDTTQIDTTKIDTTGQDTIPADTGEIVIPVDSTIHIAWKGTTAEVTIDDKLKDAIAYNVAGADVTITNTDETGEFLFVLSGSTTDGSFTYNGTYKTSFQFRGLNITSSKGAAVDIECGKRVKLKLEDGTTNSLSDAASGEQKAALYCRGHLEISGGGDLKITGNARHALASKEYLQFKSSMGKINIAKSAADGIHCGEFLEMNGGTVTLSNIGADGIQVETDADSDESLNGQFIMNGGSINLTMTAQDTKGIRLDAAENNTSIVPQMYINAGSITVNLTSTALGSKAIASDGNLTIGTSTTSPTINVTVAAGTYTDPSTDEENRATGLKAEKTLTIAGGTTTVAATGAKARGVRATTLVATGGTLTVTNTGSKSQGIKLDNTFVSGQGGTVQGNFKY